jgi:hypothetical protein
VKTDFLCLIIGEAMMDRRRGAERRGVHGFRSEFVLVSPLGPGLGWSFVETW